MVFEFMKHKKFNVNSLAVVPLYFEDKFFGALALFKTKKILKWLKDDVSILETAGEIITASLIKDRYQRELSKAFKEVESAKQKIVELAKRTIDAQEKERLYLASEIHDDLLQSLVAVLYSLQTIDVLSLDKIKRDKLIETIKLAINKGRTLIQRIEPVHKPEISLSKAIKKSIDLRFLDTGIKVNFSFPKKFPKISFVLETNMLRIIQEALTNVRKHAQATKISVNIGVLDEKIEVEVKDNGVGFNPELILKRKSGHYGLLTMRERAHLLGGELTIISRLGKGTVVKGAFPIM